MRPIVLLNALLLAAFLAMCAWLWPSLPDPIPLHFGLDGTPDRWGDRSAWWWMPGLAVVLTVLLGGSARWSAARPHLVNLPYVEAEVKRQEKAHEAETALDVRSVGSG